MLLITIASGTDRGRVVQLGVEKPHLIGRNQGSVPLDDPKVSRKHAELLAFDDGRVIVKDLGSRNGTYIDKKRIKGPTDVREGAVLQFGHTVCVLTRLPEAAAAPAPIAPAGELLETQQQTRQLLCEVRQALAAVTSAQAAPQAAIAERLEEVSSRLGRLSQLTEQQARALPAAVESLSPALEAIAQAQARPDPLAQALGAELAQVHRKLDAMAAGDDSESRDVAVHSRLDEIVDALNRMAQPQPQPQPQWVAGLEQTLENSRLAAAAALDRRLEAMSAAAQDRGELHSLAGKIDSVGHAVAALAQTQGGVDGLSARIDAVLEAIRGLPVGVDASAISGKLDDLLAIVAAQSLVGERSGEPSAVASDADSRLEAVLESIRSMVEGQGGSAVEAPAPSAAEELVAQNNALLLHVAERIDAMDLTPITPPAADQLVAEVDRHWIKLEERLMQHLRGASETAENQMRRAIAELSDAVRAMAQRSDRAVLEQVLSELRGRDMGAMQESLQEISERIRRLPGGAGQAEAGALAGVVRQAFDQVGRQIQSLPERLDQSEVVGEVLDLLRTIERHQRQQGHWMQQVDEKLDAMGAGETAVFAPITDVPMDADVEDPASASSSITTDF